MGVSIATQYKKTPEDVGDLWYFLAALADKLATESQNALYSDLGRLATEMIQWDAPSHHLRINPAANSSAERKRFDAGHTARDINTPSHVLHAGS